MNAIPNRATMNFLLCRRSLRHFVRVFWHAVEPSRDLTPGWVIDAICEHLMAVTDGDISRLIINCPPGCSKSLLTQVFWPAWEWGARKMPSTRYVCMAYAQGLTVRDNVRFIQLITSPLYREWYGDVFGLSSNEAGKIKLANDKTGWKIASSVQGTVTGERGDRLILDDPNSVSDVESEAIRSSTNQFLREVMPTRLNDPATSAIVCIQQRTHEEDATGTLLDLGEWVHLMIPMEYEPDRHCETEIGWSDPRSIEGELCWPARFSEAVVRRDKQMLGPYASAGQFQQSPTVRGGAIIDRQWWQMWGDPDAPTKVKMPAMSYVVAALDSGLTAKDSSDPSALAVLGVFDHPDTGKPCVMLMRSWDERLALHDLATRTVETCRRYKVDHLLIENKGAGHPVAQEINRLFSGEGFGVVMIDPAMHGISHASKVARAHSIVPSMADETVYSPNTSWAQKMIEQCAMFPRGSHDDLVDAFVHGMRWLRDGGMLMRAVEAKERDARDMAAAHRSVIARPLYRT